MAAMALGDNTVAKGKSIAGSDRYFFIILILLIIGNHECPVSRLAETQKLFI